ncbi:hypothetical protein KDH_67390 [Dictyobacter sp. S3.2.2.5]|uniref:DUF1622 domain-containing protein n=1 Tax=Dictyobacter halimunensis TaxID=3026934 RepID=A0ABQ6G1M9_9CHLR|nr:hypothetical protein KDH_67390 [Dictyobacter sp. S3.2.2.5]
MLFNSFFNFTTWATLIEFAGALLIIAYILASLFVLLRTRDITRARLVVADGVITGLSFKLAGTLLKTIDLRSWQQILMFAVIFALRTLLKRFFTWERARLQRQESQL